MGAMGQRCLKCGSSGAFARNSSGGFEITCMFGYGGFPRAAVGRVAYLLHGRRWEELVALACLKVQCDARALTPSVPIYPYPFTIAPVGSLAAILWPHPDRAKALRLEICTISYLAPTSLDLAQLRKTLSEMRRL